jgi:hypothetical chaperone protein
MQATFGLDFGTTNSAVAINHDGHVNIIDIDPHNVSGPTMRSVLYFDNEKNISIGEAAVIKYIETGSSGRFIQSIKSYLPDSTFDGTVIWGKKRSIEELIALILRQIKTEGEAYVKNDIDAVVLGRPVFFSEDAVIDRMAESRLVAAAKLAGFKAVHFQFEPIAAALTYEQSLQNDKEKIVLVGDFGGGTSDFTLMKLGRQLTAKPDRKGDILALAGVSIGGDTFDSRIMEYKIAGYFGADVNYKVPLSDNWHSMPSWIVHLLYRWHLHLQLKEKKVRTYLSEIRMTADDREAVENLIRLIEDDYGFMLFRAIERAKIKLSLEEVAQIIFRERSLLLTENITRGDFNEIINDEIEALTTCTDSVLATASVSPKDVDVVFLTGGSSYIPRVRKIFVDTFGADKITQMDAFTSVVYGLGISSSLFV